MAILTLCKVVHDKLTGNMFTAVICAEIAPLKPNNVTYMQVIEPPLRRTEHILSTLCHYRSESTTKTHKCIPFQPFRIIHFYIYLCHNVAGLGIIYPGR